MNTAEIRQKLFDYIRVADDKTVKAFYTIIEKEIKQEADMWTDEFLDSLNKRTLEFDSGKIKGLEWEEVKSLAKDFAKSKNA